MSQARASPDLQGKARKKAELNNLTLEIRLLEEELQRLETAPPASEACKLFVHSVEVQTDPFLRNSANPPHWDVRWDRWCKGPSLSRPTCCFVQALGRPHSMNPGNFTHF